MREVTKLAAFDPAFWDAERAAQVRATFDNLAPEWNTRDRRGRLAPLVDALDRGGPIVLGCCLELGSGTGLATPLLAGRFECVAALDLSARMLAEAPDVAPRLLADASRLPFRDGCADAVVLVNALLFPPEVERVLASPHGTLIWVNTSGPATPIHLAAGEVGAALGGGWDGVASETGQGTWAVFRRRGER